MLMWVRSLLRTVSRSFENVSTKKTWQQIHNRCFSAGAVAILQSQTLCTICHLHASHSILNQDWRTDLSNHSNIASTRIANPARMMQGECLCAPTKGVTSFGNFRGCVVVLFETRKASVDTVPRYLAPDFDHSLLRKSKVRALGW
jgi:hypothetical protein